MRDQFADLAMITTIFASYSTACPTEPTVIPAESPRPWLPTPDTFRSSRPGSATAISRLLPALL